MELQIDPKKIDERIIETAAKTVKEGGIIIFPTDTFYGIGADPFNKVAVSRVFALKQRVSIKPLLVIISDTSCVDKLAEKNEPLFSTFAEKFWPGPLTISMEAKKDVPQITTAYSGRVGMRLPKASIPLQIAEKLGGPITATSANISGEGHTADPEEVKQLFEENVDLILNAGVLKAKAPSTLIDIFNNGYKLIREGAISKAELMEVSDKLIS